MDYLEGQSRRNNIVIDGIQETANENWSESEEKVRKLISEKLQLDHRCIEMERAHQAGKPVINRERPRPIVVKFIKFRTNLPFWRRKKISKDLTYINEDYTEAVRQKRKELLPAMKAAHARGDIAYLRHDKLIVHPPAHKQSMKSNSSV